MKITYTPAQLEQFRRDAKRMARDSSISLHEAQALIASAKGFKNWSLMAKSVASSDVLKAESRPRPPRSRTLMERKRHYLHGDSVEENPGQYYCRACDIFATAEHFSRHEDNGERFLGALERWRAKEEEDGQDDELRRPDGAVNLFHASALAARAEREASRSPFHRWLEEQKVRPDAIGDLAGDAMGDKRFPVAEVDKDAIESYLRFRRAAREALEAFEAAWEEFTSSARAPA